MLSNWSLTWRRRGSPPAEARDSGLAQGGEDGEKQEAYVVVPEKQSQRRLAPVRESVHGLSRSSCLG